MKRLSHPIWPVCTMFLIFLFILTLSPIIINDFISTEILLIISASLFSLFIIYLIRCHAFSYLLNIFDEEEEE